MGTYQSHNANESQNRKANRAEKDLNIIAVSPFDDGTIQVNEPLFNCTLTKFTVEFTNLLDLEKLNN